MGVGYVSRLVVNLFHIDSLLSRVNRDQKDYEHDGCMPLPLKFYTYELSLYIDLNVDAYLHPIVNLISLKQLVKDMDFPLDTLPFYCLNLLILWHTRLHISPNYGVLGREWQKHLQAQKKAWKE